MARATAALVLVRLGNSYPPPWDAVSVGALCAPADAILDGYTYPIVLSTTDASCVSVAIDIVMRMMRIADMMQSAGGAMSTMGRSYVDMPNLSDELKERIDVLKDKSGTYLFATAVDMVED
jgi:hypothetical protein